MTDLGLIGVNKKRKFGKILVYNKICVTFATHEVVKAMCFSFQMS